MSAARPVAVITGGGGGLGRAAARLLATRGHDVVVAGRTKDTLDETVSDVERAGGSAVACVSDVSNEKDVERVFALSMSSFGACSVLLNAAAIHGRPQPLVEMAAEEWDDVVRANLRSTFLCTRAALRQMIPVGNGSIIFVASAGITRGFPGATAYSAAKSALVGLSRTLSAEVGPHGIRVNVLSPGAMPGTDLYDTAVSIIAEERGVSVETLNDATAEMSALRRLSSTEEVARAVAFLASEESSGMTAQHMIVDAGLTL